MSYHTWRVIEILQELDQAKLYKYFECSSLFVYAVKWLKLDESQAYAMITAARKSKEIPMLGEALKGQSLSLSKAVRIFSTLTTENADELIPLAEKKSVTELNREVSRIRKLAGLPEKLRTLKVTEETIELIKRVQVVTKKSSEHEATLQMVLKEFLERHDPVKKAERSIERNRTKRLTATNQQIGPTEMTGRDTKVCTYRVSRRKPLTADENHQVFARDGGQCTHRDVNGVRCGNDRYLHIHHIRPVSMGGSNDPQNLTTLCSFHHDLAHQLSLPIEGQVTWLRDMKVKYRI